MGTVVIRYSALGDHSDIEELTEGSLDGLEHPTI